MPMVGIDVGPPHAHGCPCGPHEESADGKGHDLYPVDVDTAVGRSLLGFSYALQGQAEPGAFDEVGDKKHRQKMATMA